MKKKILIALCVVTLFLIAGCTAGPNNVVNILEITKEPAGFWYGLWHGMISPIAFIISLFSDNVGMYEVYNNGGWYNFGFLLGVGGVFGGGMKGI
ncbi:MAG: hypothetical protein KKD38_01875 [Candidatus Delongbacteria bacterium]|nr:hypothetical protein [Candidatus Delongbacteria bacterium]MCG2761428.1 hypothetical protein [Candidatus Delongbacteria bacterium]